MQQVSLSNDTICRRIDDMAAVVCQQVCSEIKQSTLQASIQLDKLTKLNSALETHLNAFARHEKDRKFVSHRLFERFLKERFQSSFLCIKMRFKSFFEKTKTTYISNFTIKSLW